ncbi:MAG: RNHCP domain-containing protein [Bacilli bacterium]|jgi:DNA-directed RNA polymerase subunit RPC12/RpoP
MKRFTMRDEDFICEHCGAEVTMLGYTSRDHCPHCLYSKHIDMMPGDRQNTCQGSLIPVSIEKFKDIYKIIYRCQRCHQIHKNITAKDDDMEEIIKLTVNNNF